MMEAAEDVPDTNRLRPKAAAPRRTVRRVAWMNLENAFMEMPRVSVFTEDV
jgi:hypothetical protein